MTKGLAKFFDFTLYLAIAASCIAAILRAVQRIPIPYELNGVEGRVVYTALQVVNGSPLYPAVDGPPYRLDAYPPLLYHLVALLIRWNGVSFASSRSAVLLGVLLFCAILSLILYHLTRAICPAIAFGFFFLTVPLVQPWIYVIRVDFLALPFTAVGLYLIMRFPRRWYLSVAPFAIAIMFLYTLVAAPCACFVWLFLRKMRKEAAMLAASLFVILVAAYTWEQYQTGGRFAFYMFKTHNSPFSFIQIGQLLLPFFRTHALLVVLGVSIFVIDWVQREISLLSLYLCISAFTSFTAGKDGSQENHLLQFVAVLCICAGVSITWFREQFPERFNGIIVTGALALLVFANTTFRYWQPLEGLSECGQAYAFVRDSGGSHILSENVGALVMNGLSAPVSDPFIYRWLVKGGRLSANGLADEVRSRYFDTVILADKTDVAWPDSVRSALVKNYKLSREFACPDAELIYKRLMSTDEDSGFMH